MATLLLVVTPYTPEHRHLHLPENITSHVVLLMSAILEIQMTGIVIMVIVSELRPPTDLLFFPQMIHEYGALVE
jgi:hypothetical protein